MKLPSQPPQTGRRPERGFTMVEIVLSLAIIAIAMVAIIGVIPIGLNVQADNQEESIISADASIWMDAIRSGSQGGDYLTNFVQEIRLDRNLRNLDTLATIQTDPPKYFAPFGITSNLMGVLGTPRYYIEYPNPGPVNGVRIENRLYADIRAMNGNFADLAGDPDFSFKYRMFPELVPLQHVMTNSFSTNAINPMRIITTNLYELRLTFKWPLVIGQPLVFGQPGNYQSQTNFQKSMTFRTVVGGQPSLLTNETGGLVWFMKQGSYNYQLPQ